MCDFGSKKSLKRYWRPAFASSHVLRSPQSPGSEIIELLQYLFEDTENNIIISKIIDFDKFSFVHSQLTFKEHGQVTNRLEECILFEWAENKIINIESYAELIVKSEITQEWLKSLNMHCNTNNLIECS